MSHWGGGEGVTEVTWLTRANNELFDIFPIMNNDVNKISTLAGLVTLTQGSICS